MVLYTCTKESTTTSAGIFWALSYLNHLMFYRYYFAIVFWQNIERGLKILAIDIIDIQNMVCLLVRH